MTGDMVSRQSHRLRLGGTVVLLGAAAAAFAIPLLRERSRFVRYPESEVAGVKNVHDFKGRPLCQRCHPNHDARLLEHPVPLCKRCHSFGHSNHPVDVPAKPPKPVGIPLWEGKIVCHTCHDQHDVTKNKYGLRLPFTPLCKKCHPEH
ncbi:MAG: hypothetical protein HY897_13925 [Deltaproteobacteria bacterium]|nr:hypothetical protein [Deltaproteobacteria bacterium]